MRLLPTTLPYMIKELWPELVEQGHIPSDRGTWEWTRFGVDQDLKQSLRTRVVAELLCGCIEFGLQNGITSYLFVTPLHVATNLYKRLGIRHQILGEAKSLGGFRVVAGRIPVLETLMTHIRKQYTITSCVLRSRQCDTFPIESVSNSPPQLYAA